MVGLAHKGPPEAECAPGDAFLAGVKRFRGPILIYPKSAELEVHSKELNSAI